MREKAGDGKMMQGWLAIEREGQDDLSWSRGVNFDYDPISGWGN